MAGRYDAWYSVGYDDGKAAQLAALQAERDTLTAVVAVQAEALQNAEHCLVAHRATGLPIRGEYLDRAIGNIQRIPLPESAIAAYTAALKGDGLVGRLSEWAADFEKDRLGGKRVISKLHERECEAIAADLRAAAAALAQGGVVVPLEPTAKMLVAARQETNADNDADHD